MGGVQLLLQPSHFRLELVHLRAEGVARGGLPTAFARGQALKRPLTPRPAPFRQMGAVQTLAAKQPAPLAGLRASASSRIRSRYCAVNLRLRLGHDLRVRRWPRVWLRPSVATLLDPQPERPAMSIFLRSLVASTRQSKGCWCLSAMPLYGGLQSSIEWTQLEEGERVAQSEPWQSAAAVEPGDRSNQALRSSKIRRHSVQIGPGQGAVKDLAGNNESCQPRFGNPLNGSGP